MSKDSKLQQLITLIEFGDLGIMGVASLVNEKILEHSSCVVLCDSGLFFLQEAAKFYQNANLSKNLDALNEKFYKFVKQSLQLFSLARKQSVFIDLVCLVLKNAKLPKSLKSILKGFKNQAYSDAFLQQNRVIPAVQNSMRFY
jgi:hypothetical protein